MTFVVYGWIRLQEEIGFLSQMHLLRSLSITFHILFKVLLDIQNI